MQPRGKDDISGKAPRFAGQKNEYGLSYVLGQMAVPHQAMGRAVNAIHMTVHQLSERVIGSTFHKLAKQLGIVSGS